MNRITSVTSTLDGVTSMTYDKRSQITVADHANPRTDESYAYDDNGNRTGGSYTTGTNNQTTADANYTYTYDKEGNRTRRTKTSDSSYEEYTWDHRNRLTKVSFKTSGGTETKNVEYAYDLFNRLIRRKYDADGPGSGAATNVYLVGYDGINPTLAFDGTAKTDVSNRFLWGPAVDQLFADEQVTTTSTVGNVIWPLADQVGTLRDLVDFNESTSVFTVTNHRTFDSFGNLTAETQSAVDEIFAYTGKFFDDVTKLSNHLNRWLDPNLGKWISEDPIGFQGGDSNISRYVGNSASIAVDSNGLEGEAGIGVSASGSNSGATGVSSSMSLPRLAHMVAMAMGPANNSTAFLFIEDKSKKKLGHPKGGESIDNPNGTVTVHEYPADEKFIPRVTNPISSVTGEVIQGPGTRIDFPRGTFVIGTNHGLDHDVDMIGKKEDWQIRWIDGVASEDTLISILDDVPDGSLPGFVLVGHGAWEGGVNKMVDGFKYPFGNDRLWEIIGKKLKPDAVITILGCEQFMPGSAKGIKHIAEKSMRSVVCNESHVRFGKPYGLGPKDWWGDGRWFLIKP